VTIPPVKILDDDGNVIAIKYPATCTRAEIDAASIALYGHKFTCMNPDSSWLGDAELTERNRRCKAYAIAARASSSSSGKA
jgi:hypothetical protein